MLRLIADIFAKISMDHDQRLRVVLYILGVKKWQVNSSKFNL